MTYATPSTCFNDENDMASSLKNFEFLDSICISGSKLLYNRTTQSSNPLNAESKMTNAQVPTTIPLIEIPEIIFITLVLFFEKR